MNCFIKEGVSAVQYAAETLDPIAQYVSRVGIYTRLPDSLRGAQRNTHAYWSISLPSSKSSNEALIAQNVNLPTMLTVFVGSLHTRILPAVPHQGRLHEAP